MCRLLAAVVLTVLLGVALVVSNGLQLQTGGPAPAESGSAQPSPGQGAAQPGPTQPGPARSGTLPPSSLPPSAPDGGAAANPSRLPTIRESQLPREGRATLALIRRGGPFPYERDGVTFGNFERILPRKSGGYYREYTVPTPGESDRGARRIVAGQAGEKYYTADHYESFRFIAEGK
jgi:ribonuclease T1